MDNYSEVFAKLPNPCARPSFYTTASEVATRKLVSAYLKPENRNLTLYFSFGGRLSELSIGGKIFVRTLVHVL